MHRHRAKLSKQFCLGEKMRTDCSGLLLPNGVQGAITGAAICCFRSGSGARFPDDKEGDVSLGNSALMAETLDS